MCKGYGKFSPLANEGSLPPNRPTVGETSQVELVLLDFFALTWEFARCFLRCSVWGLFEAVQERGYFYLVLFLFL